jgi:hypothetical protein
VAQYRVKVVPSVIRQLDLLPDGRLIGSASNYENFFLFDPKTSRCETLGKLFLSHYATCFVGGKVYLTGYPSTRLYEYDPAKPWTVRTGAPPLATGTGTLEQPYSPTSNPRHLVRMADIIRTHHGLFAAAGADGRVYVGAHAEHQYGVGGGLGWWDPKTETYGGLREPFEPYDVAGLAAANKGTLIVYSSRTVKEHPSEAKLFFYDTRQVKIVREVVPLPGRKNTGLILEALDGVIVGMSPYERGGSTLYAVQVSTGNVLRRRDFTVQCVGDFRLCPDGHIWTFLSSGSPESPSVLARINPANFDVKLVGRVDSPSRIAFVGGDVYLAGQPALRRVTYK